MAGRISPNYGFSRSLFAYDMPGERTREVDGFTCRHCNFVTKVKPFCDPADAGGLCKGCMCLICAGCASTFTCDVIEKKLERSEARQEAIRSYGL